MIRKLSLSTVCILCLIVQEERQLHVPIFAETAVFALHTLCNKIMSKLDSLKEAQTNRKSTGRDMGPFVMINCKPNVFIIISCTLK